MEDFEKEYKMTNKQKALEAFNDLIEQLERGTREWGISYDHVETIRAALEAPDLTALQKEIYAQIDRFQDVVDWQDGESRNTLVTDIRDKVDAIFRAKEQTQ